MQSTNDILKVDSDDELLIYQNEDGTIKLDVLFDKDTVWLSMEQMGILFGKSRTTILGHIQNIYKEGELQESNTIRKVGISDFSTKPTSFYNLDVIISVGYRVHSRQGTLFRIWATFSACSYVYARLGRTSAHGTYYESEVCA